MHRTLLLIGLLAALACGGEPTTGDDAPLGPPAAAARVSDGPHPTAVVAIADLGEIHIELLPEIAPKTVANFEKLVAQGLYEGTTFHRVLPGFMVQGGDPLTKNHDPRDDGRGNPGFTIEDEFTDYPHLRGTVSMANTGTPYSAGSQFFIVLADSRQLDGQYTAFGRVTRGMEVADAIAALEIDRYGRYGPPNRPYPVSAVVETVRIEAADAPVDVAQREDGVAR